MGTDKLSVIIPTIYKKPRILYKLIQLLEGEDIVNEIILISNVPDYPMTFPLVKKLKVFEPQTNTFVYTGWNFGISIMQNDNFLILNDDILFCEKFCESVINSDVFNDEKTGLIGLSEKTMILYDKKFIDDIDVSLKEENINLVFEPMDRYMEVGFWGSAIFGKKQNYHQVPDCFNIFFGDNYLLYQNIMRDKINYFVSGVKFHHIHNSSSTGEEFVEIRDKERWAWAFYTLNYINKNKY